MNGPQNACSGREAFGDAFYGALLVLAAHQAWQAYKLWPARLIHISEDAPEKPPRSAPEKPPRSGAVSGLEARAAILENKEAQMRRGAAILERRVTETLATLEETRLASIADERDPSQFRALDETIRRVVAGLEAEMHAASRMADEIGAMRAGTMAEIAEIESGLRAPSSAPQTAALT